MVYYRKYRPQTIEELDSTKVRETLTAVLSSKNIPHAFLFTGPKGLGKTSIARIIAKMVNCQNKAKGSIEPCNTCDSCVSITAGSNIDVLEIDGASNRGIDEIRDLRDKVKLAPSSAAKKVYIIDEVHMLTTEAFNALLKTIEEPPAHVMFVFATTEPQKVPATILSRCFHVAFPKATNEDIIHSLERIVKGESLEVEKGALLEIAKLADGGFRDAAKILEELVAVSDGKKITKEIVEGQFHASSITYFVSNLLTSMSQKNVKECLEIVQKVGEQGTDMKYFISQILDCLHELLLVESGVVSTTKYQLSTKFSLDEIKRLTDLFTKAYTDTKYAVVTQLPLELAVIEWCLQGNFLQEDEITMTTPEVTVAVTKKAGGPTLDEVRKKEQTLKVRSIIDGKKDDTTPKVVVGASQGAINHNMDELSQLMENIIYKVRTYNHSLAGVLRGCDIASYADGKLQLATAYKFHKDKLQEVKAKELLEKVIREITGKETQILIELKG